VPILAAGLPTCCIELEQASLGRRHRSGRQRTQFARGHADEAVLIQPSVGAFDQEISGRGNRLVHEAGNELILI
jgi:hypothetical protein